MNAVSRILLDMHDDKSLPLTGRERKALHDGAWLAIMASDASVDSWGEAVSALQSMKDRIEWSQYNLARTTKEGQ